MPELLTTSARAQLVEWSEAAHPQEACGFLLGSGRESVVDVTLASNVAASARTRYEISVQETVAVEVEARTRGLHITGVWHSHPCGPAALSTADRRTAVPGLVYVVVAGGGYGQAIAGWRVTYAGTPLRLL